ncbi:phage Gp37/Gp68 family protein [Frigidibacter oleivorans]|uniref:phage Gp37/Gp68 family protein n=1 Tax=Frigidibacter oleivorans TaxID=2487129 RepID=UPI000F8E212E|nr:phage Gp37/Gp68 family protein [Frigidibacter oleivorans]
MAENSTIEWTDATWNPITGCTLVSEGCRHCYAAELATTRLRHHPSRAGLARRNAAGEAKFTGEVRFNEQWLDQPLRWRRPRRVFVCAHGDLFHESVPDEWIDRVFAVMALCPQHTFQVLTKRPERMREYLSYSARWATVLPTELLAKGTEAAHRDHWPLPNVWLGTSIEDQATADARIPHLLATPAAVRFLSAEPLLGPVDLRTWIGSRPYVGASTFGAADGFRRCDLSGNTGLLDWVIVGGESGRHARPMHPDWARSLRDQCVAAGVPFFFKQWGEWGPGSVMTSTGEQVFRTFPDFQTWINKAPTWVNGGVCLDAAGRHCTRGADFMRARDEGTFPVTVLHRIGKARAGRHLDSRPWDQMPGVVGC